MRKLFKLVGEITIDGMNAVNAQLRTVDKEARKAERVIGQFGKNAAAAGASLTRGLTVPLVAFGVAAFKGTQAASDLAETVSKVGELFGSSKADVEAWAKGAAVSFGQSQQQAMDAAATFAIFGKSAGKSGSDLVGFTTDFAELASDLASFNNTSPEDAILAIGAAMRGENEPIRRYGVLLDDASMRQKALELGIISTVKNALTPQQKVLAASALIMQQTTAAQGDFARTSGGLANQQRILSAQIKDMTAQFGQAFLPVALQIVGVLREKFLPVVQGLVDWFGKLSPEVRETIVVVGAVAAVAGPLLVIFGQGIIAVKGLAAAMLTLNAAMLANPFILAAAAIGLVAVAIIKTDSAYEKWKKNLGSDIAEKQARSIKADVEAIIPLYNELALMDKQEIGEERFRELSEQIKILEKNLGDAGIAFEGSFGSKALAAENYLTDLAHANVAAAETTDELSGAIKNQTALTEEQLEALKKLKEEKERLKDEEIALIEQANRERAEFEQEWSDKVFEQTASRVEMLEHERDRAIELAHEKGASVAGIEAYYKLAIMEEEARIDQERIDREKENSEKKKDSAEKEQKDALKRFRDFRDKVKDTVNAIFDTMSQLYGQINDIMQGVHENETTRIDQRLQKDIEAVNASTMSQKQKADAITALEEEADKKKRAIAIKAAKRDKAAAIFGIIISTAQAIMKSVAQLGPIAGAIAGVAMGILGAAQIAVVASKPLPMRKGGLVKGGRGGITAEIGEADQDEIVVPLETGMDMFVKKFTEKLNSLPLPSVAGGRAAQRAGGQSQTTNNRSVTLQVGTLIADDRGLRELDRRLRPMRISEDMRLGLA